MTTMIEKQVIIEKEDVGSHYQSWTDAKKVKQMQMCCHKIRSYFSYFFLLLKHFFRSCQNFKNVNVIM
jgi:hypothetical protein